MLAGHQVLPNQNGNTYTADTTAAALAMSASSLAGLRRAGLRRAGLRMTRTGLSTTAVDDLAGLAWRAGVAGPDAAEGVGLELARRRAPPPPGELCWDAVPRRTRRTAKRAAFSQPCRARLRRHTPVHSTSLTIGPTSWQHHSHITFTCHSQPPCPRAGLSPGTGYSSFTSFHQFGALHQLLLLVIFIVVNRA